MILERLEITGFGCLHDVTAELHPRVTVITGRNEFGQVDAAARGARRAVRHRCRRARGGRSIAVTGRASSRGTAVGTASR